MDDITEEKYPDEFIRGISDPSCISEDKLPNAHFLKFETLSKDGQTFEESINWFDEDEALKTTFLQEKDGKIQFTYGAFILDRMELEVQMKKPMIKNSLSYNRDPLRGNDYHGNILLQNTVEKKRARMISSSIAINCFIRYQEYIDYSI